MSDAALPERSSEAEDAFVRGWAASDDTDALVEVIGAAVSARRPQLAARLVGLLDGLDDALLDARFDSGPGSPLARARAAARLFLASGPTSPADNSWSALEDAWADLHREWVARMKHRMRAAAEGRVERPRRFESKRKARERKRKR